MANIIRRLVIGTDMRWTLIRAAGFALVCFVVFGYILKPIRLEGESMEPNYTHGSFTLVNRLAYRSKAPQRGDVVAVRLRDSGRSIFYLKRVVGLPGEAIGFEDGQLTVDRVSQTEGYLIFESNWTREPVVCGPEEFFVVGDNRSMPIEQHTLGRTYQSRIVGKVIF